MMYCVTPIHLFIKNILKFFLFYLYCVRTFHIPVKLLKMKWGYIIEIFKKDPNIGQNPAFLNQLGKFDLAKFKEFFYLWQCC